MTWKSSFSITSDDENSVQSFLSDCDSEFDLRPPPRYPAEKRSSSISNKRTNGRIEPPLTRSRLKATGKTLPSSPTLPKTSRSSTSRRSTNTFTNFNPAVRDDLHQNMFLFTKQEALFNERVPGSPGDGVNFLTDRLESFSLDEEKINRSRMWPSKETYSRYMRPVNSAPSKTTFGGSPFSIFNHPTTPYSQSSSNSSVFGQHQAQLWSRFHFAASELRNDICVEQVQTSMTNLFTPNSSFQSSNSLMQNSSSPLKSQFHENVEPQLETIRQRKSETPRLENPVEQVVKTSSTQSLSSSSKFPFTMMIFAVGIVLGYFLTSTFPPNQLWQVLSEFIRWLMMNLEVFLQYFQLSR